MVKQLGWISFIISLLLTGCTGSKLAGPTLPQASQSDASATSAPDGSAISSRGAIIVFAAASLTGAFQEIGGDFEAANPGMRVSFNFGGSQILSTQLEQGAQADVFASASPQNIDLLVTDHLVQANSVQYFAANSLIVILPPGNPGRVSTLADLARPRLKIVLADSSVPAGDYARQALSKISQDPSYGTDFSTRVLANVVSNETDVKQVVTKVELGEADAGIVYVSDAVATPDLLTVDIPVQFNIEVRYPIAPLSSSPEPQMAERFITYVTSPEGQATLAKWGFTPLKR